MLISLRSAITAWSFDTSPPAKVKPVRFSIMPIIENGLHATIYRHAITHSERHCSGAMGLRDGRLRAIGATRHAHVPGRQNEMVPRRQVRLVYPLGPVCHSRRGVERADDA